MDAKFITQDRRMEQYWYYIGLQLNMLLKGGVKNVKIMVFDHRGGLAKTTPLIVK